MNLELKQPDYFSYTFEEFLQDDFFISSIKCPDGESKVFWKSYEDASPLNINEYIAAKDYLSAFETGKEGNSLSVAEVANLWNQISITNSGQTKRRSFFLIGMSAAASIAILLGTLFFLKTQQKDGLMDISSFALHAKVALPSDSDETLLILSEKKVLNIKENDSEITYDSTGIKTTNNDNVSKEEIASYNQLVIPRGKRSVLTFSDGSKVWANAGTRVIYPSEFEKDKREIYVDGEIYIEVARDQNRPFYVRTKDMNVRVLGTKFNVTAYESDPIRNVVLVSGRVQVETEKTPDAVLAPNQMFSILEGKEKIQQVDVEKYISWVHGLYSFDSEDLGIVLKRLSTYYGINVDFDPAISKIKCSGKIDLKDGFETVLNGLTFVAPISYVYDVPSTTYRIEKK